MKIFFKYSENSQLNKEYNVINQIYIKKMFNKIDNVWFSLGKKQTNKLISIFIIGPNKIIE